MYMICVESVLRKASIASGSIVFIWRGAENRSKQTVVCFINMYELLILYGWL